MNQRPPQPELPEGTYAITPKDKEQIVALGRVLNGVLHEHFKTEERVHMKIVLGAFNYIVALQKEKQRVIGEDFLLSQRAVEELNVSEEIEEPYTDIHPDAPEGEEGGVPTAICLVSRRNEDGTPGIELGRFNIFTPPGTEETNAFTNENVMRIAQEHGVEKKDIVVAFGSVETVATMDAAKADPEVEAASLTPSASAAPVEEGVAIDMADLDGPGADEVDEEEPPAPEGGVPAPVA